MNGKHLLTSEQVVISEKKNNTLLIHEYRRFLDTQSECLSSTYHTAILHFDIATFLSHIQFTKAILLLKQRQLLFKINLFSVTEGQMQNKTYSRASLFRFQQGKQY